jgi:hypothetical protein
VQVLSQNGGQRASEGKEHVTWTIYYGIYVMIMEHLDTVNQSLNIKTAETT